jgi:outer membrane protein
MSSFKWHFRALSSTFSFALKVVFLSSFFLNEAAKAGDLIDIYQAAKQINPQFLASQYTLKRKKTLLPQAKSELLPRVHGSFSENWPDGSSSNYNIKHGITVTQPLNIGVYHKYKATEYVDKNAEVTFNKSTQELISSVIENYFASLLRRKDVTRTQSEYTKVVFYVDQLKRQFKLGRIGKSVLYEALALKENVLISLFTAEGDYQKALFSLRELTINCVVKDVGYLDPNYPLEPLTQYSLKEWDELSMVNNLDIKSVNLLVDEAFYVYKATNAEKYPTASLTVSNYQSYNQRGLNADDNLTNINVSISANFFDFGAHKAKTSSAKHEWRSLQQEQASLPKQIKNKIGNLYSLSQRNIKVINSLAELIKFKRLVLDTNKKSRPIGQSNISEILTLEREIYSIDRQFFNAQISYILNEVKIKQMAGALTERDLYILDKWIIPDSVAKCL